ncbi:hypothetical protein [Goodfellowiella coeruleoviolacea]|uniref:Uncharacterized protein n=1 Tax=Goodfellowiella coeruleoviolacea TaxID=334858 RepID=A0AAE3GCK0_9PSEU|nr:hypothetical protein [Goodfellowiella coeruleoviolacea]MCP2164654.1 hypothetical protein [Goodfellowiella coeruleoviolacea]
MRAHIFGRMSKNWERNRCGHAAKSVWANRRLVLVTGAYLFVCADPGAGPLDTFAFGPHRHVPSTVGLGLVDRGLPESATASA